MNEAFPVSSSRQIVKSPRVARLVGRPRDHDKARAILDAAWLLFLERGVEATSIEAIAAAAKVSKVTLYTHYPDRVALFEASVRREMERIEQAQGIHRQDIDLPFVEQLSAFGMGLMFFLTSKPAIDFYSVVAAELRRHENLARAFYDLGPGRTRANLAALLDAGVRSEQLRKLDPHLAAEELFGLWQGFTNFQFSLGIDIDAIRADLGARVERGVCVFMLAYGVGSVQPCTRNPYA